MSMGRSFRACFAAAFLGGTFSAAAVWAENPAPPNFGTVVEHGVYRGAQPEGRHFAYLQSVGIKTILKLNSESLGAERQAARASGIRLVLIPLDAWTVGSADSCPAVAQALGVISDRANWPVYVHCVRGRDRTGFIIGLYRRLADNWDWGRIDQELARHGHAGTVRWIFPRISRELARGRPACLPPRTQKGSTTASHGEHGMGS